MRKIDISKRAQDFLKSRQAKQSKQIAQKILSLGSDPMPGDSKKLTGTSFYRVDCGEFRIIYDFTEIMIRIVLVGKRNDGEVYRQFTNLRL
ncbi:MAG: type II toxin-antitoxin system RelE/ParE family toxin [Myxococcaceae bacterium]